MIKIPTSYNLNQTLASICNLIAHPVFMLIAWQKPSLVVCISPPTLQGQPPVPGGKGQPTTHADRGHYICDHKLHGPLALPNNPTVLYPSACFCLS